MEKEVVKASDTPQIERECYVVPDRLRKDPGLVKAIVSLPQNTFFCQYSKKFMADYDHEGKQYCILHLPLEVKKEKKLMRDLNETLKQCEATTNYDFISVEELKIDGNKINPVLHRLSFKGASIGRLDIDNIIGISEIDLNHSKIESHLSIINCKRIERIYFKHCDLSSNIKFNEIEAENIIIENCYFHSGNNQLLLDYRNKSITICNSSIKNFTFNLNTVELVLNFSDCNIESLNLEASKYYIAPRISESNLRGCKELILPSKKDFLLKKLESQFEQFKKETKNLIWMDQYRSFREIYNLAKNRDMYYEQSDYFHLMHLCLEKNSNVPILLRAFSTLYNIFSNYGQSIVRPILSFLGVLVISIFIYFSYGIGFANAGSIAIKQIIKPYSLMFDKDQKQIFESLPPSRTAEICELTYFEFPPDNIYKDILRRSRCFWSTLKEIHTLAFFIGFMESTLALIFLTLFLLALRWNFRKA